MPRIIHFSDTHLGHQQYAATDPGSGLNQREADHYAAFDAVIDHAIDDRPDVVIHAGDLFDGVRPSNRALAVALEGFLRLSKAQIPAVIIAGNHEHPKMRATGSPMRLLAHLDGVHVAFMGRRETYDIGGMRIHAVPQVADHDELRRTIADIDGDGKHDVLVVHGAVHSLGGFKHAEFNEMSLDPSWFDERFAYVALGHFHEFAQVNERAWYCGAPDRVSIAESGQAKGFIEATTADGEVDVRFHQLDGRPYADLSPVACTGLDEVEIHDIVAKTLARLPPGAVARLPLKDIPPQLRGTLDLRAMQNLRTDLLTVQISSEWADDDHHARGDVDLGGLSEEFEAFAATFPIEGLDRSRLLEMGRRALQGAME